MRLLIVLAIGAAFFFLQDLIFKKNWFKGLDVDVDYEKHLVREGDKNTLIEVIRNDKLLPLPVVLVKISMTRTFLFPKESNASVTDMYYRKEYFTLRPYQIVTRKYPFTASRRGEYKITSVDVVCKDYFLVQNANATGKNHASVLVLPGRIKEGEIPKNFLPLAGEMVSRIRLSEDPFSFKALREYQPYDPINHINWKATARGGDIFVNTYHTTNRRNVILLLNMETDTIRRGEVVMEAAIKIASFLAGYFVAEQIPVALYSNGCDIDSGEYVEVDAGCDEGHVRQIDIALARIQVKDFYKSFLKVMEEHIKEEEILSEFILISNNRSDDIIRSFGAYQSAGFRMTYLVPEHETVSIKPLEDNGRDVLKWGIDHER